MGSTRLPGKVLLGDPPILERMVKRLRKCVRASEIHVLTTMEEEDEQIAKWCSQHSVHCYRHDGAPMDVADRFLEFMATKAPFDQAFVRVCADSPEIHAGSVDKAIYLWHHKATRYQPTTFANSKKGHPEVAPKYVLNDLVTNVPNSGNSVEVVCVAALRQAYPEMDDDEREHVTKALYKNKDRVLKFPGKYPGPTIDTREDLVAWMGA